MAHTAVRRIFSLTAASALALALAACSQPQVGEEAPAPFALGEADGAYDFAMGDDVRGDDWQDSGHGLGDALPMQTAAFGNYAAAPSWNYGSGGYTEPVPSGDWGRYDEDFADSYYEETYGTDDEYYVDEGAEYYEQEGSDSYSWLAIAALIGSALGSSPPDFAFSYDDVQPWAWRTSDGYHRYAEPVRGGYRHYYYEPRASRPFLVRDPLYSYGFRGDRLVVVYDRDGRVLRRDRAYRQRRAAFAHLRRGSELFEVSRRSDRHGIAAPLWAERRQHIVAEQDRWERARRENRQWQRWRSRHGEGTDRRWQREAAARERASELFSDWQQREFRGDALRLDHVYRDLDRGEPVRQRRDSRHLVQASQRLQPVAQVPSRRDLRRGELVERRADLRRDSREVTGFARADATVVELARAERRATVRAERRNTSAVARAADNRRSHAARPLRREQAERLELADAGRSTNRRNEERQALRAERQASARAEQRQLQRSESEAQRQAERLAERQAERQASQRAEREERQRSDRQARREAAREQVQAERRAQQQSVREAERQAQHQAQLQAQRQAERQAERRAQRQAERQAAEQAQELTVRQAERRARQQAARDAQQADRRARQDQQRAQRRAEAQAQREQARQQAREQADKAAQEQQAAQRQQAREERRQQSAERGENNRRGGNPRLARNPD